MANVTLSNLPVAVALTGAEIVPIDQSNGDGTFTTKRTTAGAISSVFLDANYVMAGPSPAVPSGRALVGTSGDISVVDNGPGSTIAVDLVASGVTAASYGTATAVGQISVDAFGRVTTAVNVPIAISPAQFTGLGAGVATFLTTPSSANLAAAITDETGTGALVFANGPTMVAPVLGTPASVNLTNGTNLPVASGISGLGTGVSAFLATPTSANLAAAVTNETGTGSLVFGTTPTLVTPILGTPTSVNLTNGTNLPVASGISGLATGIATFLATPTSANLATAVTDETGSGALVFGTSPTLVTPVLGTPASVTLTNGTGLPIAGISGLGTGVGTFLATPSSANLAAALTDETGSGLAVFATSPALTTPNIGVATATSVNKVAITAPATSATLTIADGKTATVNNTLTLSGTDSTTMTFPSTSANVAALNLTNQALTGGARVTPGSLGTITSGTVTPDPGTCPMQYYTNNGAHTLAPGSNKGQYTLEILNAASAGAITTSGWTKVTGDALTTTNTSKFTCSCIIGQNGSLLVVTAMQ